MYVVYVFISSRRRHTSCALVTGVQTCALPICVAGSLNGMDPWIVRAAGSLGASPVRVFRHVTLPNIMPGVVTGAVFAFATRSEERRVGNECVGACSYRWLPSYKKQKPNDPVTYHALLVAENNTKTHDTL